VEPGPRIHDRFELQAVAGSGGMGTVWRALDHSTGALVALKLLHQGADSVRFDREAGLLATLVHPGIVGFVARGLDAATGSPYLAMEWLDGEDLEALLGRGRRLGTAGTLALAHRVAKALAFAHDRGVVHRDLKPSNLLLVDCDVERVKLLDFGIALGAGGDARLTHSGTTIGTPAYMAPEQARGERSVGPPADVFSLGCVLFECLTGRPAFTGEHVIAVLAKILLEEAPRASDLRPDVPPALDDLVARMLAKEGAARPADGGALARELAQLNDAHETVPHEPRELHVLSIVEQRLVSVVMIAPLSVILSSTELIEAYAERWSASKCADHFRRIKAGLRGMTDCCLSRCSTAFLPRSIVMRPRQSLGLLNRFRREDAARQSETPGRRATSASTPALSP